MSQPNTRPDGAPPDADQPRPDLDGQPRRADDGVVLIRRLSWASRVIVLALIACVIAPVVMAYLRVQGIVGSAPRFSAFGDSAYLALRSRDVLTGHLPLIGSQSSVEGTLLIMQPGPAQFYAQAPFTAMFGGDLGTLLFAGMTSIAATVGSVWVMLRRFGVAGAAAAAIVVVALEAQLGSGALVDSISSTHGQLPMFFAVVATAMVVAGDRRLFPVAVAAASYPLQVHLSFVGYGLVLAPLLAGVLIVGVVRSRRGVQRWFLGWAAAGILVGIIMWAPPLIDQFFETGNLANVVGAGSGDGVDLGIARSGRELLSGLASSFGPVPALLAPPDRVLGVSNFHRATPLIVIGLAMGALAAVTGVRLVATNLRRPLRRPNNRTSNRPGARSKIDEGEPGRAGERSRFGTGVLLVTGVVLALVGVLFASRLRGFAIAKPNNNRWMVIAGAVVVLGALAAVVSSGAIKRRTLELIRSLRLQVRPYVVGATAAALLVAIGGYSATVITRPLEPTVADPWLGVPESLAAQADAAWGDRGPVRLYTVGAVSAGGIQPAVMLGLEERGTDALTLAGLPALRAGYGEHRLGEGSDPPYVLIQDGDLDLPQFDTAELLGVVVAQPPTRDRSEAAAQVRRCLEGATAVGDALTLTAAGERAVAKADSAGEPPQEQLLAATMRDPQALFLTRLAPLAEGRGYIEPIERSGCSDQELAESSGDLFLTAWLVE